MIRPGEGIHLGVVTATLTRSGLRELYFPAHERGMAHDSYPSPDRHWALVVEMDGNGDWAACRLLASSRCNEFIAGSHVPSPV